MECREGDRLTVACDIYGVCVFMGAVVVHVCTQLTCLPRSGSES